MWKVPLIPSRPLGTVMTRERGSHLKMRACADQAWHSLPPLHSRSSLFKHCDVVRPLFRVRGLLIMTSTKFSDFLDPLPPCHYPTHSPNLSVQSDNSGCDKPPVDIKTKVLFCLARSGQARPKRDVCFDVNGRFVTT